jgi:dihydroorotate dehydrogenase electron transfer subunit
LLIVQAKVEKTIELDYNIFLLQVHCPEIAKNITPGQFLNVRVTERVSPLLRRPFSVCDVEGEFIFLMFNVMGEGTNILAHKSKGSSLDILGPLGNGFSLIEDYDTAVVVAGGLGAAPFPYVTRNLKRLNKNILSFVGGKTQSDIIKYGMENLHIATDDGSEGFKGNVVQLLESKIDIIKNQKTKIFACGPNAMLKNLQEFCFENKLDCEISTECAMACGFGICQGCPVESAEHPDKYLLVCKDGPVFNVKDVRI